MNSVLDQFWTMTPLQASVWLLAENAALFFFAVGLGDLLVRLFRASPTGPVPDPISGREILLAMNCVLGNTLVTILGWWLWRMGVIVIRRDTGARAWLDVIVLLLVMDLAMYVTHRIAHIPAIYRVVHCTHHLYDRPRPLDLFVLNPLEVLGFGCLWLTVISLYASSWLGIVVYLALNLSFGMVGHLGVEPLPNSWSKNRLFQAIGTSTFHSGHHRDEHGNFGFYTTIWDRVFGTLLSTDRSRLGPEIQNLDRATTQ